MIDRSDATKNKAKEELEQMGDVHYGDQENPSTDTAKELLSK